MKPRTARLRQVAIFRKPSKVSDGAGGFTQGYADQGRVGADYRPISANRAASSELVETMKRATLRMRAETLPQGFDPVTWRISVAGADHTILSGPLDEDGDNRFLSFVLGHAAR